MYIAIINGVFSCFHVHNLSPQLYCSFCLPIVFNSPDNSMHLVAQLIAASKAPIVQYILYSAVFCQFIGASFSDFEFCEQRSGCLVTLVLKRIIHGLRVLGKHWAFFQIKINMLAIEKLTNHLATLN